MEKKKKPAIRFKGFTDSWEQRKFDKWGDFYYGHSCPKWSVTEDATIPCIRYGELYTKFGAKIDKVYSYTNMPTEKLRFSKGTEVLIPRVGEDPMDYNHCTWLSLKDVAIGEMISVFNTDQDPLFSATMFNATLQKEFAIRVEGGSVTNLYFDKLRNIDISYPLLAEQKKIAAFFENLDHLITLHQRKYDKLQIIKKAMLEKMFPQNGSCFPEIRFKGFTDSWEQRKLGDEAEEILAGGDIDKEKAVDDGVYPIYANALTNDGIVGYYDDYYRVKAPAVTVTGRGEVGHAQARIVDFTPVVRLLAIRSNHDCYFLENAINNHKVIVESTGVPQLTVPQLSSYDFCFPKDIMEEKKIGTYFNQLDHLITLHQREVEKLQNIKKSMLETMFV